MIGLLGFFAAGLSAHVASGWPALAKAALAAFVAVAVALIAWQWRRHS